MIGLTPTRATRRTVTAVTDLQVTGRRIGLGERETDRAVLDGLAYSTGWPRREGS
jgi:hypothetical protein